MKYPCMCISPAIKVVRFVTPSVYIYYAIKFMYCVIWRIRGGFNMLNPVVRRGCLNTGFKYATIIRIKIVYNFVSNN